ncbi:MAG: hypothetical protein KatS3mg068_1554 [Candidatus Sericytochromatia bacterium]|nr:MAG: hypothetical protein KatS3mg068_1554 [Candidatus Sericytochromatia bacterium]
MKIFISKKISGKGIVWSAKNGATRTELLLISNHLELKEELPFIEGSLSYLKKKNQSFIFINPPKKDDRIMGIFLNSDYGHSAFPEEKVVFEDYSVGGYGNSCSQFGIYMVGTVIKKYTYKHRNPPIYFYLHPERGWINFGDESGIRSNNSELSEEEIENIKKIIGLEEPTEV